MKNFISLLICLCLFISSPPMVLAASVHHSTKRQNFELQNLQQEYQEGLFANHPLLAEFIKAEPLFSDDQKPRTDTDNQWVDRDPYFMRAQEWVSDGVGTAFDESDPSYLYFFKNTKSITLKIKDANLSLRIDLPLTPLFEGSEYIFFSARSNSKIFPNEEGEPGEGLFYIAKADLYLKANLAQSGQKGSVVAVPVFYFALPGSGWLGNLTAFEWNDTDSLVVYNSEDHVPLPIELADIHEHHKYMKLNLAFSRVMTLFAQKNNLAELPFSELLEPYPARGSTAGFGSFLTGVNLDDHDTSFWSAQNSSVTKKYWVSIFQSLLPQAQADIGSFTSLIDASVLERVMFLGKIIGSGFVASVALKYSIYRNYFRKKYNAEQTPQERLSGLDGYVKGAAKFLGNETKGVLDVYAHTLATVAKAVPISIIDTLEYLGDRFATSAAGPNNSVIRKEFLKTFGWARSSMKNLAVNSRTWFLGSVVMGAVDTLLVVVQLLFVTPFVISKFFMDPNLAGSEVGRANEAELGDSATSRFVTSEIIRNAIGYFTRGAVDYSYEQRLIVQDRVRKEIDVALRREGKNPQSKEVQKELESRVEERMEQAMKLRGLPGKNEFLFDAVSVKRKFTKLFGYDVTGLDVPESLSEHFVLEYGRWGLAKPALNRAYKVAVDLQNNYASPVGAETVKILKKLKSRWSYLTGTIKMGATLLTRRNYFKEARQVRQALTLLSFGEDVKLVVQYLPKWMRELTESEEALLAAARIYNNSFFSIVEGNPDFLQTSDKTTEVVRNHLRAPSPLEARDRLQEVGGDSLVKKIDDVYGEAKSDDAFVARLADIRAFAITSEALQRKGFIDSYQPAADGVVVRWQKEKAERLTVVEMAQWQNENLNNSDYVEVFKKKLATNLSQVVGLYPKSQSKFIALVEKEAEEATQLHLAKDEEKVFVSRLSSKDQLRYEADVYAQNFMEAYIRNSVQTDQYLPADSSEQPGFFQKIRQFLVDEDIQPQTNFWKKIKKSVVSTKFAKITNQVLRVTEALWNTESYGTGLVHMLDRNIPFWNDGWRNFVRNFKLMPFVLSFGYLSNYYIWQVKMDYPIWVLFFALMFTGTMMVEFNNRMMQNMGRKPMEGVRSKAMYSFFHSWLTYPVFIPVMLWAEPITKWYDSNIKNPVLTPTYEAVGKGFQFTLDKAGELGTLCDQLLK